MSGGWRESLSEALGLRGGWRDSAATILRWVAECDGPTTAREESFLRAFDGGRVNPDTDIAYACAKARRAPATARVALTSLAVDLALLDGELHPAERLALEFLADVFGASPARFDAMLARRARPGDAPTGGDPSDPAWHRERERERRRATLDIFPPRGKGHQRSHAPSDAMTEPRARALLGVARAEDATPEALRAAFRALAQSRHPDKFADAGEDVQLEARRLFEEARAAFRLLADEEQ